MAKVHAEEKCDICVKLATGVLQIPLSLLHLVLLFFFLLLILSVCLSVCLYVSCLCLWALLPDLNKMMMIIIFYIIIITFFSTFRPLNDTREVLYFTRELFCHPDFNVPCSRPTGAVSTVYRFLGPRSGTINWFRQAYVASWCIRGLIMKAQNDRCDVERPQVAVRC